MLSAAASNTLLKTLEEPPAHVVFVLATTDPQKVLPTIRSRTQHFEFTLLSAERAHRPPRSTSSDGRASRPTPTSLDLVVRRAAGSARDALSLLDQALAVGGGTLDAAAVQAAFGGAPFDLRVAVLEAVAAEDVAGALVGVHELLTQGHDVRRVADDLLRTLRDAFMAANADGRVPYDGPAEEETELAALAQAMGNALRRARRSRSSVRRSSTSAGRPSPTRAWCSRSRSCASRAVRRARASRRCSNASNDWNASWPRVAPRRRDRAGTRDLWHHRPRLRPRPSRRRMRHRRHEGRCSAARTRRAAKAEAPAPEPPPAGEPPTIEAASSSLAPESFDLDDVIEAWPNVLEGLKAPLRAAVQQAQPIGVEQGVVVFGVPRQRFDMINGRFRNEADTIKDAFAAQLGFQPRFMLRPHDFDAPGALLPVGDAAGGAVAAPVIDLHEEEQRIDLNELVDAPDVSPPPDTVARLVSDLGAQVVEERPRD